LTRNAESKLQESKTKPFAQVLILIVQRIYSREMKQDEENVQDGEELEVVSHTGTYSSFPCAIPLPVLSIPQV